MSIGWEVSLELANRAIASDNAFRHAARRGDRMAQRLREEWRRDPIKGKLIADFDAGRLRRDRGQPKGFFHERLYERDRYIIALVETAQAQIAEQTGLVNTLGKACWEVAKYFNRERPADAYPKIWNIMRRHITRQNARNRNAK